jgi:hypothetical protein
MRRWGVLLLVCFVGLAATGAPPGAWFGRSSAMILLPPGGTWSGLACGPFGTTAQVARGVTPRIEVSALSSSADLFHLGVKVVLVEDLVPLFVAATLGTEGIGIVSTLFFGPVRLDWGRTWGEGACRWGSAQLSARPRLSMFVGVEVTETVVEPFTGVRIFPSGHGLWEIGVSVRRDGIRLSTGGALW